jgi:predicted GNAT family acetyltransferase
MTTDVIDNTDLHRYEIVVDGAVAGFADYRADGDTVVLPHTVVDPARRGQGLAAVLIRYALDDIAGAGGRVVPACSYVADFIDRHPEYRPLLAEADRPGR